MANLWRRQPGTLRPGNLVRKGTEDAAVQIALGFFEAEPGGTDVSVAAASSGAGAGAASVRGDGLGGAESASSAAASAALYALGNSGGTSSGTASASASASGQGQASGAGFGTAGGTASGELAAPLAGTSSGASEGSSTASGEAPGAASSAGTASSSASTFATAALQGSSSGAAGGAGTPSASAAMSAFGEGETEGFGGAAAQASVASESQGESFGDGSLAGIASLSGASGGNSDGSYAMLGGEPEPPPPEEPESQPEGEPAMSTYYLINTVKLAAGKLMPGTLLDNVGDATTYNKAIAAGGLVVLTSDAAVAAAAALANDARKRGANEAELESIMQAGLEASQIALDATQTSDAAPAIAAVLQSRTAQITYADLTSAVNGEAQAINIGAALPANAVVVGHEVNVATLFSGGSATAVKLDVGGTTATHIVSQMDVFTGAATGALSPRTGAHAQGKFSAQQLKANFTPDAGHTLDGLTAGDLTVTVWFHVLP